MKNKAPPKTYQNKNTDINLIYTLDPAQRILCHLDPSIPRERLFQLPLQLRETQDSIL